MMARTPRESFRRKAPLIDVDELASVLTHDIMSSELRERATGAWVIGSFADPGKRLDRGDDGWSDLDIFVTVPEWHLPQADSGIALAAPQVSVPSFIERNVEGDWKGVSGPEPWDCPASQAWQRLPAYAQKSLRNAVRQVFFRSESEMDDRTPRYFDLFIGTMEQLEYQHQIDKNADSVGFRVWPAEDNA